MSTGPVHAAGRPATRRSSLPRYDLRRRVLVSNLSRNIVPAQQASCQKPNGNGALTALPSKPSGIAVPLDLLKDIPTNVAPAAAADRVLVAVGGKRASKMHCVVTHPAARGVTVTPEKKASGESKFRIDPAILLRNPIVHTPVKAVPPKRRYSSEPVRDTMSLHLLKDDYAPPAKRDRLDATHSDHAATVLTNFNAKACPSVAVKATARTAVVDGGDGGGGNRGSEGHAPPPAHTRPVPLPRKSKMVVSSSASVSSSSSSSSSGRGRSESRSVSSMSSHSSHSTDSDPIYARIENCRTGSREDVVRCGLTSAALCSVSPTKRLGSRREVDTSPMKASAATVEATARAAALLHECSDGKRRNSLQGGDGGIRLRPRFGSTSGECRARKSLLFSDGVDSSKATSGMTLKNIYAENLLLTDEAELLDDTTTTTMPRRVAASPSAVEAEDNDSDRCSSRVQPRILNQSGIYSNNTLVVESRKLKNDEVDRSYGFTCRMRPMLRALSGRKVSQFLLPNKNIRRNTQLDTPLKGANTDQEIVAPASMDSVCSSGGQANVESERQMVPGSTTPNRDVAIQTSFIVHNANECPRIAMDSPTTNKKTKRRRSMEIIAEVGATVKRKSSTLRDRFRRSLDATPGKTVQDANP